MSPHTTVSHQQPPSPQQQQQQPPTAPQQQSAQNPMPSGPPQNANIPSHIAQTPPQHIYSQPPPNFVPHSGGMYQLMQPGMPNVYVNNVTANVNLHGYMSHHPSMPHYMSANAPPFIPAEMQQQQQQGVIHEQQSQVSSTSTYIRGGGIRGRGRGRGGNGGVSRRDYGSRQPNTQEVQQPVVDQQSMLQHGYFINYPYYAPQHMPVGMPSAQHATGNLTGQPLYASNNMMATTFIPHQLYGYQNLIYPPMVPSEYSLIEGKVDESPENAMQQMWHPIPMEYADQQMQQIEHAMHPQHSD